MESENKMKKKIKSADNTIGPRAIDMVPKVSMNHTLRIKKAEGGGYSMTHEMSGRDGYSEKVHIAKDKKELTDKIGKIL